MRFHELPYEGTRLIPVILLNKINSYKDSNFNYAQIRSLINKELNVIKNPEGIGEWRYSAEILIMMTIQHLRNKDANIFIDEPFCELLCHTNPSNDPIVNIFKKTKTLIVTFPFKYHPYGQYTEGFVLKSMHIDYQKPSEKGVVSFVFYCEENKIALNEEVFDNKTTVKDIVKSATMAQGKYLGLCTMLALNLIQYMSIYDYEKRRVKSEIVAPPNGSRKPKKLRKVEKENFGVSHLEVDELIPLNEQELINRFNELEDTDIKIGYWRKNKWIMPYAKK